MNVAQALCSVWNAVANVTVIYHVSLLKITHLRNARFPMMPLHINLNRRRLVNEVGHTTSVEEDYD
jgi:hypothetical protein